MNRIDYGSLQTLELTYPKMSASDAQTISENPINRLLSKAEQDVVKRRALEIDTLTLIFRLLFKDLNYLEHLVNAIKKLSRPGK